MKFLENHRNNIQNLCLKHKVTQLFAFGSVLTSNFKDNSDIDLIVNFDKVSINNYADNYYSLKFALEDVFKRSIDLLEGDALKNPHFNRSVEQQCQLIFGAYF